MKFSLVVLVIVSFMSLTSFTPGDRYYGNDFPVHAAVSSRYDLVKLERLLASGADVNARDKDGHTALHITSYYGNIEGTIILLEHGADPRVKSNEGLTPNHYALDHDEEYAIRALLLKATVGVNGTDALGRTPLYYALRYDNHLGGPVVTRYLIAEGADIRNYDRNFSPMAVALGLLEDEKLFLTLADEQGGIGVVAKKYVTNSILIYLEYDAPHDLEKVVVEALLDRVSDPNADVADADTAAGLSALGAALGENDGWRVASLLAHGADANATNRDGRTPLMQAAEYGRGDVVSVLLAHGVDIDAVDRCGNTAIKLAERAGHSLVVKILRQAQGANRTAP